MKITINYLVKKSVFLVLFISVVISLNFAEDDLSLFYNADSLLNVLLDSESTVEHGDEKEITDIRNISVEYQNYIEKKVQYINEFYNNNDKALNSFFSLVIDSAPTKYGKRYRLTNQEKYPEIFSAYKDIQELISENFFSDIPECVRVMWSYERELIFVEGRQLNERQTATLERWYEFGLVFWANYYFQKDYSDEMSVVDSELWFYETNLKFRIVMKLVDSMGNYQGEISVDFYKLNNTDILFSK